jgi:hypothetical protein
MSAEAVGHHKTLLAVREDGDDSRGDLIWPIFDADTSTPRLEAGEPVLLQFWATVSQHGYVNGHWTKTWDLPEPCQVTVTDRRVVYVCRKFQKGSSWVGFGVVGATVAGTAMAISAVRARRRRAGRAAVGQLRHEWLVSAILRRHDPTDASGAIGVLARMARIPAATAMFIVGDHVSQQRIDLVVAGPRPLDEDFVRYVGCVAAHGRLARTAGLSEPERAALMEVADRRGGDERGHSLIVTLPGATPIPA